MEMKIERPDIVRLLVRRHRRACSSTTDVPVAGEVMCMPSSKKRSARSAGGKYLAPMTAEGGLSVGPVKDGNDVATTTCRPVARTFLGYFDF